MEEVDQQPLDVGTIVILIGHDHQVPIAQLGHVCVLLSKRQPERERAC